MRKILFYLSALVLVGVSFQIEAVQPYTISPEKSGARAEDNFILALAFPDEWSVSKVSPSDSSNVMGYIASQSSAKVDVLYEKLTESDSFDTLIERESKKFIETFDGKAEILEVQTSTLPNETIHKHVVYKITDKEKGIVIIWSDFYEWRNNVYWLTFSGNANDWAKKEKEFRQINDSVYILLNL